MPHSKRKEHVSNHFNHGKDHRPHGKDNFKRNI